MRRLTAEALGSCILVATVVGSGIMGERLAGGNDAIALLGNTFATGAILFVLITIFAPLSGAHFNPAVTLAFLVRREISVSAALLYAIVQCVGAVAGTMLAHFMFDLPLLQESAHVRAGAGQFAGEIVATMMLVLTIFGCRSVNEKIIPAAVAAAIMAGYWYTSSTSFANPAVTLARSFTDSFSGISMGDVPAFVSAQLLAAIIAASLAAYLWPQSRAELK